MEYFFIVFNIKGSLIDHLCKVCMRPTFKATLISNFKTASYFQKKNKDFQNNKLRFSKLTQQTQIRFSKEDSNLFQAPISLKKLRYPG